MAIGGKWVKVKGIVEVQATIGAMLANIETRNVVGLLKAAEFIHEKTETESPTVPVGPSHKKGNRNSSGMLRDSWKATHFKLSKKVPIVQAGFHTPYALFVHERFPGNKWGSGTVGDINWTRPDSGAKYLETPFKRHKQEIINIVALEAAMSIQAKAKAPKL